MAFTGLVFVGVIFLIIVLIIICAVVFLVVGLLIRKTHKTASKVFLFLSGMNFALIIAGIVMVIMPHPKTLRTQDGSEIKIQQSWIDEYDECLQNRDINALDSLLGEHSEMALYYDTNRVMLLDYGMYNLDINLMQCAIRHGAKFDDPLRYEHTIFYNSLDSFFDCLDYPTQNKTALHNEGAISDKMIQCVKYAIEHGAKLDYQNNTNNGYQNFYDEASAWVSRDNTVTPREEEFLQYLYYKLQEEKTK